MERLFSNKKISKARQDIMGYVSSGCSTDCYYFCGYYCNGNCSSTCGGTCYGHGNPW